MNEKKQLDSSTVGLAIKPELTSPQETKALVLQVPDKAIIVKVDSGVPDWVSPSIQIGVAILAATASVGTILWQMRKQRELTLKQQQEATKAHLRLDAYREFQKLYADFNANLRVSVNIRLMFAAFQQQLEGAQKNIPVSPIQYREPIFRADLDKLSNHTIELVYFLERHAPLLPGFEIFKTAFGSALNDVRGDFGKFQAVLLRWLPIENPNFGIQANVQQFLYCPAITSAAVEEFQVSMEPILKSIALLECWASDLSIDIQNHLLGEYADQYVMHRVPIDSDYFVVTSDSNQRESLEKHFMNDTEFGRAASAAQGWAQREQAKKEREGDKGTS